MMGRSGLLQCDIRRSTSSWTLDNEPKKDTHASIRPLGILSRDRRTACGSPSRARLALVLLGGKGLSRDDHAGTGK